MDEATRTWQHSQPMPMRGSPCVVSEANALAFTSKMQIENRIFLFSDSDRAIPGDWDYLASARPGVPPEGILSEVDAWLRQYPDYLPPLQQWSPKVELLLCSYFAGSS